MSYSLGFYCEVCVLHWLPPKWRLKHHFPCLQSRFSIVGCGGLAPLKPSVRCALRAVRVQHASTPGPKYGSRCKPAGCTLKLFISTQARSIRCCVSLHQGPGRNKEKLRVLIIANTDHCVRGTADCVHFSRGTVIQQGWSLLKCPVMESSSSSPCALTGRRCLALGELPVGAATG